MFNQSNKNVQSIEQKCSIERTKMFNQLANILFGNLGRKGFGGDEDEKQRGGVERGKQGWNFCKLPSDFFTIEKHTFCYKFITLHPHCFMLVCRFSPLHFSEEAEALRCCADGQNNVKLSIASSLLLNIKTSEDDRCK